MGYLSAPFFPLQAPFTTPNSSLTFYNISLYQPLMMWPDGYYYQRYMFYCNKWKKEMEKTFVTKLVESAKNWQFRPGRDNKLAINKAIDKVMIRHDTQIDYGWGKYVLKFLRERHDVFGKLVSRRDVVWNKRLKFVTALDSTWQEFSNEERIGKCYMNAYEDLWEELCQIFAEPVDSDSGTVEEIKPGSNPVGKEEAPDSKPILIVEPVPSEESDPLSIGYVSESPASSSSLWNVLDEFNGSDSDADSVLPLPGVPTAGTKLVVFPCDSSPSGKSEDPVSSTASNGTPLKKFDGEK